MWLIFPRKFQGKFQTLDDRRGLKLTCNASVMPHRLRCNIHILPLAPKRRWSSDVSGRTTKHSAAKTEMKLHGSKPSLSAEATMIPKIPFQTHAQAPPWAGSESEQRTQTGGESFDLQLPGSRIGHLMLSRDIHFHGLGSSDISRWYKKVEVIFSLKYGIIINTPYVNQTGISGGIHWCQAHLAWHLWETWACGHDIARRHSLFL